MKEQKDKEKVYCIFNSEKENITEKIGKAFEIYLKEWIKTKEELEKSKKKH
ncbi:MAG: hypothetical protein HFJ34_05070 [Clostridia bacterium]|nr:hypothetical protein [Clostridia bacterium]